MATTPVLRNFEGLQSFFPTRFSEEWHISPVRDDDIVWSIVLAYLNSFSQSRKAEVSSHVNYLLRRKVGKNIAKYVENCNPFLYKNGCFCNEMINIWVDTFRKNINCIYRMNKDKFPSNHPNYVSLQASSLLLSCNIILIREPVPETLTAGFIKEFPDVLPRRILPKKLIIFVKWENSFDNPDNYGERFSFCIPKELGFQKQNQALQKILLKTKIAESFQEMRKIVNRICSLSDIRESFIISLLKSDDAKYIPLIYKSPYVLSKLRDAAIETDPSKENKEGKSGFFYASTMKNSELLYFLYDHVANSCLLAQSSIRSPDPVIVMNLVFLKDLLIKLQEKVMSSSIDENQTKNSLKNLSELCRFNDFQINICRAINTIRQKINYYQDSSTIYEAEQRKDVIINILLSFDKYFDWMIESECSKDEFSHFKEFYLHGDYFDNLDFCSAIMFFDNLYLLKERLMLTNSSYLKIESVFFFFIYCRKYFETYVEKDSRLKIVSRMIIFQERLSLKKFLCSFRETLEKVVICSKNVVDKLPENVVRTLTNKPQIYSEFLVLRLKHYLNAATSIRTIDKKAVLIIQRVLQVIGECMKEIDFKCVQKILPLMLPDDLVSNLKKIRNELAHPKDFKLPYRHSAENNEELFHRIQLELSSIKDILSLVFSAHMYTMNQYVLLLTQKAVHKAGRKKIPENHQPNLMAILPPNEVREQSNGFQSIYENCFRDMYNSLSFRIASINRDEVLTKFSAEHYKYVIKNLFCSVKKKLKMVKVKCKSAQEGSNVIDDDFWAIEYLLIHITKDKNLSHHHRRKLLKLKNDRKTLFLKTRINEISKNDNFISVHFREVNASKQQKNISSNVPDFFKLYNSEPNENVQENETSNFSKKSGAIQPFPKITRNINLLDEREEKVKFDECVERILIEYEMEMEEIFADCHRRKNIKALQFNFKSIGMFRNVLKGHYYLNGKEKKLLLRNIPTDIKNELDAKRKIENFLQKTSNSYLTKVEFKREITKLSLKDIEIKRLLDNYDLGEEADSLAIVNSIRDYISDLQDAIEKNEIGVKNYETLCEKLQLPPTSRDILKKIVQGQKCKERAHQLEFLRDRIKLLKEILINENQEIKQLWETAKSSRKKVYVQERLVQEYLNDPGIQASVEMLLFDCMNILKTKDLQNLCRKTTNLFNGINLRNVLAHGNPLLESLGRLLDPYDLPSELVRKMLGLINDLETIECMLEVQKKSGNSFSNFMCMMNDDEDMELKIFREKIIESDNWKQYAFLLP